MASGRGPNAMRARLRSESHCHAQVASALTVILLWRLHKSQGCFPECCGTPPAEGIGHRPWRMVTGHKLIHRLLMDGRSALHMAGRPNLPAESVFDSSRGQNIAWQCISSNVCTNHTPYHIHDSKGYDSRFSDHQSRISMHDGPRNQVCILIWNAMHIIKQRGGLNLYHTQLKRWIMHANAMHPRYGG